MPTIIRLRQRTASTVQRRGSASTRVRPASSASPLVSTCMAADTTRNDLTTRCCKDRGSMGDDAQAVVGREVVDLDRVRGWMDERALGDGPLEACELIAGGTQNVLLRFRRGTRSFVLRRPPPHKRANSDETMRREARVLGALAGTDVPHPALLAAEGDVEVLGAA